MNTTVIIWQLNSIRDNRNYNYYVIFCCNRYQCQNLFKKGKKRLFEWLLIYKWSSHQSQLTPKGIDNSNAATHDTECKISVQLSYWNILTKWKLKLYLHPRYWVKLIWMWVENNCSQTCLTKIEMQLVFKTFTILLSNFEV